MDSWHFDRKLKDNADRVVEIASLIAFEQPLPTYFDDGAVFRLWDCFCKQNEIADADRPSLPLFVLAIGLAAYTLVTEAGETLGDDNGN